MQYKKTIGDISCRVFSTYYVIIAKNVKNMFKFNPSVVIYVLKYMCINPLLLLLLLFK